MSKLFKMIGLLLFLLGTISCGKEQQIDQVATPIVSELAAHTEEFTRRIEKVSDNVWMAIGYGLANSILVEGEDGLIVIDTMETMENGKVVASEFRKLSDKPLRAIVYTHNHTDHVFGSQAFVEGLGQPGVPVEVFAHDTTEYYVNRIISEYRPIISARSYRMFGVALGKETVFNDGIGLFLAIDENSTFGFVKPTRTFSDTLDATVAGIKMQLHHAPGETNDQLFVWFPDTGMLALGDNMYKAFPNLYTIRGTPYRSLKDWSSSIDKMRSLPVQNIVPSHGGPIRGAEQAHNIMTDYRDAIQFVHNQTVRYINQGLTPDEVVAKISLPPHLAKSPYLQEFYGMVDWSARSVFSGNLGWFDGNPSTLKPLSPRVRAEKFASMAGGVDNMLATMDQALQDKEYQWVLEITDHILRLSPENESALSARIESLKHLGQVSSNPNARHYFLSSALELEQGIRFEPMSNSSESLLRAIPMESMFEALQVNLRAEETLDTNSKTGFSFTDSGESWTLWLRRGVLEIRPELMEELDLHVEVDSLIFKKVLGKQINGPLAIAKHFDFPVGNTVGFAKFMALFAPEKEAPEPAPFAAIN